MLKGARADRLLDTYHLERHPIERDVLRQTGFITQLAEADHGPMKLLRERVMPVLAAIGPLRDAARRTISELSIQYRRSPLTLERVLDGGPRAGERAPDARVHVVDGPLGRAPGVGCLYDLHDPGYLLAVPAARAEGGTTSRSLPRPSHAHALRIADLDGSRQQVERAVAGRGARMAHHRHHAGEGAQSLTENLWAHAAVVLSVRPDGYIAARGRAPSDVHGLLRHCETWFSANASVADEEPPEHEYRRGLSAACARMPRSGRGRRRRQLLAMLDQRLAHDRLHRRAGFGIIERVEDREPHARLPEAANVIGDAVGRFVLVRQRIEKLADPVRHVDQVVHVHVYFPEVVTSASAFASVRISSNSSCCVLKRE